MLNAGLENLLEKQKSLKVFGIAYSGARELDQAISIIQPDIIIADRSNTTEITGEALNSIKSRPGVKIILVNLEDNHIEVYDNKRIFVKEIGDFLSEIC